MSTSTQTGTMTHAEDGVGHGRASAGAALYLALECEQPAARAARYSLGVVESVVIGRGAGRTAERIADAEGRRLALGVADRWMSGTHARLSRVLGRWLVEDAGSKNGTLHNGRPVERAELADGDVIEVGHTLFVYRASAPSARAMPPDLDSADLRAAPLGLRTLLPSLDEQLARLTEIARSDVSVVVHGETGTGKELIARAVHALSDRAGPFVAVNCGALPPNLVASELFGHRRGAFSGATEDRLGLVRSAERGTLFLDEIGDLPRDAQPMLLRVLQEREVVAVGTERPIPVDLRLVAATHRDLDALVATGELREDLLARIAGLTIRLPPLRERREELGLLVGEVLEQNLGSRAAQVRFTVETGRALMGHDWPTNIRGLASCLGAAVVLAGDGPVRVEHLPEPVRQAAKAAGDMRPKTAIAAADRPLSEAELRQRDQLVALLREHSGNVSAVARALGKARMQVQRWLKRYGLDAESFRT